MNKIDIVSSVWFRVARKILWKNRIIRTITVAINDKNFSRINYFWHTLKPLNIKKPMLFTEKLQWINLYNSNHLYSVCSDKYEVRKYVENIIADSGIELSLINLIEVYENVEQIDFDKLPNSFVFKANHGSGWNLLIQNKKNIDEDSIKKKLNNWLNDNYYFKNREIQYKSIAPKIVCEEFLKNNDGTEILDYKFMCFDGEINMVWIDYDRHTKHIRNFYDVDGNPLGYVSDVPADYSIPFVKPNNYDKMLEVAKVLSKPFPHVRVDLYNVEGVIYFGEMTFSSWGGFVVFNTPELDRIWGDLIDLNKIM